jgi:RNA polymerase sigma factor (sigma-70 family)
MRLVKFKTPTKKHPKQVATVLRGNRSMQRIYCHVRNHLRQVSQKPRLRYSYTKFREELFAKINSRRVVLHGITIPEKSIQKILAVKDLETLFVQTYSGLVVKLANKCATKIGHSSYSEVEDFESIGLYALVRALYGYNRPKVKFITYATWVVSNRMLVAANRTRTNFPWPNSLRKLYCRYELTAANLASQNLSHNFESVCQYMGMSPKEQDKLRAILTEVVNDTDLEKIPVRSGGIAWEKGSQGDYTAQSAQFTRFRFAETLEPDQRQVLEDLQLNEWQMDVLEGYMSGHYGWQTEVSKKHGKSRAAPLQTLRQIQKKIRQQMEAA